MKTQRKVTQAQAHSWDLRHWPEDVYPHSVARARYLVRMHRKDLLAAGALTRIGREIVVLGNEYRRWLASNARRVQDFVIAPNRDQQHQESV